MKFLSIIKYLFVSILCSVVIFFFYIFCLENYSIVEDKTLEAETNTLDTNNQEIYKEELVDTNNPKKDDWNLILVSNKNLLEKDLNIDLVTMSNGIQLDSRIFEEYTNMLSEAHKEGLELVSISGYRSVSEQEKLYTESMTKYENNGDTEAEAKEKTEQYLALPKGSEHATGLAVDIVSKDWEENNKPLDDSFSLTAESKWLEENAYKYGFIIRYPKGKEDITGINYESWHLRYVGIDVAKEIKEKGITLEEYLEKIN